MADLDHDPELEATIRDGLAELVAHGPDPAMRTERIDRREAELRNRFTRRRQFLAGVAATTVAVGAGVGWAALRNRRDSSTSVVAGGPTTARPSRSTSDWIHIPPAPLSDRRDALVEWAGDRLIVLGGVAGTGTSSTGLASLSDGAAWLPDGRGWVPIPPAPAGAVAGAFSAWNGSELLVGPLEADSTAPWNLDVSAGDAQYGLAAYDVAGGSWRYVAPLVTDPLRPRQAALVGDRLLIADLSARPDGYVGPVPLFSVNPTTGATDMVPLGPSPFASSPYPDGGGEVVLTAVGELVVAFTDWDRQPWILDLGTGSWRIGVGPAQDTSAHLARSTAVGDRAVVSSSDGSRLWLFDPTVDGERAWQTIVPNPFPPAHWGYDPVWSGTELFVPGAAYDPAADSWREVPMPPREEDRQRTLQARWTGDGLLLFGGEEYSCPDGADCDRSPGPDTLDGWLLRDP